MARHEGLQTTLTIALHRVLYLAIIMDRYAGPNCPYYSLENRPLITHYYGPS
jgi:hypothetical protein